MNVDEVRRNANDYREIIQFCADREAGLVTLTLEEYLNLAPIIRYAWHIYVDVRKKNADKQRN